MDNFFNTVWFYVLAGELGLLFRLLIPTVAERRRPSLFDLYAFCVWSIFVVTISVLLLRTDLLTPVRSSFTAFLFGLAALEIWPSMLKTFDALGPAIARFLLKFIPTEKIISEAVKKSDDEADNVKEVTNNV